MAVVQQRVRGVAVQRQSRAKPAWLDFLRALGYVVLAVPVIILGAVLEGFMLGESDPE